MQQDAPAPKPLRHQCGARQSGRVTADCAIAMTAIKSPFLKALSTCFCPITARRGRLQRKKTLYPSVNFTL